MRIDLYYFAPLLFLLGNRPLRPLTRTCVRFRPLPPCREPAPMAQSAIGSDIHETLDVHDDLASEFAFNLVLSLDYMTQLGNLLLGQVGNPGILGDFRLLADFFRKRAADTIYSGECDFCPLLARKVNTCYSRHRLSS